MENHLLINGEEAGKEALQDLMFQKDLFLGKTPFTSVLLINGKIPFWELHHERLKKSFNFLYPDQSFAEMETLINKSIDTGLKKSGNFNLRLTMVEGRNLVTHFRSIKLEPVESIKLKTAPHPLRYSTLPRFLKNGNYLEIIEEVNNAKDNGFDDCLFLDKEDLASECSTSNVFFRRGNRFFAPSLDGPVLEGVTRTIVLDIMKKLGYVFEELSPNRVEWESMEEVFITNSIKGLVNVSLIDTRKFEIKSELFEEINKVYQERLNK